MNYSEILFDEGMDRDMISERLDDAIYNLILHRPNIIHLIGSAKHKRWHYDSDVISELISKVSKTTAAKNIEIFTRKSPVYAVDPKNIITERDIKRSYHKYIDSDTPLQITTNVVDYAMPMLGEVCLSCCAGKEHTGSKLYVCNDFCDYKMYPRDKNNSKLTEEFHATVWYHNLHQLNHITKMTTDSITTIILIDVLFDTDDIRSEMKDQSDKIIRVNSLGQYAGKYANYIKLDLRPLSKSAK